MLVLSDRMAVASHQLNIVQAQPACTAPCEPGYECVLQLASNASSGLCVPCRLGQHCARGAMNEQGEALVNVCPAGRLCVNASTRAACPAGYACPMGTHTGNVRACAPIAWFGSAHVRATPGGGSGTSVEPSFPVLPWCLRNYCATGSASRESFCPAGSVCTGFGAAATRMQCPAAHFCATGVSEAVQCASEMGRSAAARCAAGSASQPAGWQGLALALLLWGALVAMGELAGRRYAATHQQASKLTQTGLLAFINEQIAYFATRPSLVSEAAVAAEVIITQPEERLEHKLDSPPKTTTGRLATEEARQVVMAELHASFRKRCGQPHLAQAAFQVARASSLSKHREMGLPRGHNFVRIAWRELSFAIGRWRTPLLSRLDGHVEQGELVALMGESGSGKSTLLNVLAGRAAYGTVSGELTLNGVPYAQHRAQLQLQGCLGLVPQSHACFDELTVFENLELTAQLRGPHHEPPSMRLRRVEATVRLLGLEEVRHLVVGGHLGASRLSGGQRRRVDIGCELVAVPMVLLLDEPCSALDAVNTRIILSMLSTCARSGMCVVASIHQPRLADYQMFDRLLLLAKGRLLYGGRSAGLQPRLGADVRYFASLGFDLPEHANPADFFVEIGFGLVSSDKDVALPQLEGLWRDEYRRAQQASYDELRTACPPDERVCLEQWASWLSAHSHYCYLDVGALAKAAYDRAAAAAASGSQARRSSWLFSSSRQLVLRMATRGRRRGGVSAPTSLAVSPPTWEHLLHVVATWKLPPPDQPGFVQQLRICTRRYLIKRLRLRQQWFALLLTAVLLSVIAGGVSGPTFDESSAVAIVVTVALYAVFTATLAIDTQRQGASNESFRHEASGGVKLSAEVLARHAVDLIVWLPLPLLYALPFSTMTNTAAPLGHLLSILLLLTWAISPLGYAIVSLLPAADAGSCTLAAAAASLVCSVFLSTQLGPAVTDAPVLLALSPPRWAVGALILSAITHQPFSEARAHCEVAQIWRGLLPGKDVLSRVARDGGAGGGGAGSSATSEAEIGELMQNYGALLRFEMGGDRQQLRAQMHFCRAETDAFRAEEPEAIASLETVLKTWAGGNLTELLQRFDATAAHDWLAEALLALLIIGLVLRGVALAVFVQRHGR